MEIGADELLLQCSRVSGKTVRFRGRNVEGRVRHDNSTVIETASTAIVFEQHPSRLPETMTEISAESP